jgi:methylenetetrahydrofolate dehydrogenase (NADP+)/methenyltetrahydrofolate cyclohydrolase
MILDGKAVAQRVTDEVRSGVAAFVAAGTPAPVSRWSWSARTRLAGVRAQQAQDHRDGRHALVRARPARRHERGRAAALIDSPERRPAVNGILVQLPLPKHIDAEKVTERIDPKRTSTASIRTTSAARAQDARAAAVHAVWLHAPPQGDRRRPRRHARRRDRQSNIVGRPMALELLMARCTVTICHSATRDLPGIVRQADIVVAASARRTSCSATG